MSQRRPNTYWIQEEGSSLGQRVGRTTAEQMESHSYNLAPPLPRMEVNLECMCGKAKDAVFGK